MKSLFGKRLNGVTGLLLLSMSLGIQTAFAEDEIPPEVAIGERLFLETRFSFSERPDADPVMAMSRTVSGTLPGPFRGQSMNCRSCHLVDEQVKVKGGGMRSYADFARRSPVTVRIDGNKTSVRNAQQMVDITSANRAGMTFHYDGEFASLEDLVKATLTGRNFGWLPTEYAQAKARIISIVRTDDGKGELAKAFGGSYRKVLKGTAKDITKEFHLPRPYRVDVDKAGDDRIVNTLASLISVYVRQIHFVRNKKDEFNASPYDEFLKINQLPRKPAKRESALAYSRRLLGSINKLTQPEYVEGKKSGFKFHDQPYRFGKTELNGLKVFFTESGKHAGNCVRCHTAPFFSDFGFHNTGVSQNEYDRVHGAGAFNKLVIPGLKDRHKSYDRYLPATVNHPEASGVFRAIASKRNAGATDLGLWNVYANSDMPRPQKKLHKILCGQARVEREGKTGCDQTSLLRLSVARFKTPIMRDLGHSTPYMHNGSINSLEETVTNYLVNSRLAKAGKLRNASPHLRNMQLSARDINPLSAFLRSLNEDYE